MKYKLYSKILLAIMVVCLCLFAFACGDPQTSENKEESGNNEITSEDSTIKLTKVSYLKESEELEFTNVDGAKKYEIIFNRYNHKPFFKEALKSPFKLEQIESGEYSIIVRALDENNVEIGNGSLKVTFDHNIAMPQSPKNVKITNNLLTWEKGDDTTTKYSLVVLKDGNEKARKDNLTETTFDLSSLKLSDGNYVVNVYGYDKNNVQGTAGVVDYRLYSNCDFGKERVENEYYIANFRNPADRSFCENVNAKIDDKAPVLSYTDGLWSSNGVWFTLPEPIKWSEVYKLKFRTRRLVVDGGGGCYAYLFSDKGSTQGIYPEEPWTGFGTETVEEQEDSWVLTTFSAENIRKQNMNDSNWENNLPEYLSSIFFGSTSVQAIVEIDYITYTKRTAVDNLEILYDGNPLKKQYSENDKFNWKMLSVNGDYHVEYKLYKDGATVEFKKEHHLAPGNYSLTACIIGINYGEAVAKFEVKQGGNILPGAVSGIKYENGELSWNKAENAVKYKISATYSDGTPIPEFKKVVEGTSLKVAMPIGKINVIINSISQDGFEGRDIVKQVTSIGNTNFLKKVDGSEDFVIADFNSDDYNGFITKDEQSVVKVEGGKLKFKSFDKWGDTLTYELPENIRSEEVALIKVRINGDGIEDNKAGPNMVIYNQKGEKCFAYLWATGWYGITKNYNAEQNYWDVEFSFKSIKNSASSDDPSSVAYKWTGNNNYITKIVIGGGKADILTEIDYIHMTKSIVVDEPLKVTYKGNKIAEKYPTTTEFNWDKLSVEGYKAKFTLYKDGVKLIDKPSYLEKGSYKLKVELTGLYYGETTISFDVEEAVVPDPVQNLTFDKETGLLSWDKVSDAVKYLVTLVDVNQNELNLEILENGEDKNRAFVKVGNLPVGKLNFVVYAVSDKEYNSIPSKLPFTVIGNTQFDLDREQGSIYKDIAKFTDNDWLKFIKTSENAKVEIKGNVLNLSTTDKAKWNEIVIDFPHSLNVENLGNYLVEFLFETNDVNGNEVMIKLFNEEGKPSRSYAIRQGFYGGGGYNEGGVENVIVGDGNGIFNITISADKLLLDNDNEWTGKKAKELTKALISWHTGDGELKLNGIRFVEKTQINYTTDVKDDNLGKVVVDFKDENSLSYNEIGVKNGSMYFVTPINWVKVHTINLEKAVNATKGQQVSLRVKGCIYIKMYNSNNQIVKGRIAWHDGWFDGEGEKFTTAKDGEYTIITFTLDNDTDIKKIDICGAEKDSKGYIDYIAVK